MTKFRGFNRAWSVKVSYRGPIATDGDNIPSHYGTFWRGGYAYEYGMTAPHYPVPAPCLSVEYDDGGEPFPWGKALPSVSIVNDTEGYAIEYVEGRKPERLPIVYI